MTLLVNPATGTVVDVQGDLELRYRARGWAEPIAQSDNEAIPEEPVVEIEAEVEEATAIEVESEVEEKPATRSNAKRSK